MTESSVRWLTREALVLAGLFGLLFSAGLYAIGLGLASVDALLTLAGQQLPSLLKTLGAWGVAIFMAGEGVLMVGGWLLRLGAHSDDRQAEGQQGKDEASR